MMSTASEMLLLPAELPAAAEGFAGDLRDDGFGGAFRGVQFGVICRKLHFGAMRRERASAATA